MTPPARVLALVASLSACADDPAAAIEDTEQVGTTDSPPDPSSPSSTTADPPSTTSDPTAADEGSTSGEPPTPVDPDGLGPASFDDGELDPPSHGGTITFEQIGAPGWYPSRRDPAVGPCDAYSSGECCLAQHDVTGDQLTPWDEDLVLTLRGPMQVKQLAVYQPQDADAWALVSAWDADTSAGLAFHGNGTEAGFGGEVRTECLVDVSTDVVFDCGSGSSPFCPESDNEQHFGWAGSKLFVLLARMPHADETTVGEPCSEGTDGNWWDAPWLGLSHGELMRAGAFSDCQCYAKNPAEWWLGDGCGQFNVFEVVNDNNDYRNLDVFSTNFFGYGGYVGEGPCGDGCDVSVLGGDVDLIDKGNNTEAGAGATASPTQGPGAAFRRPAAGYRYFLILLDVEGRTVQLGVVHPEAIPGALDGLLPGLRGTVTGEAVSAVRALRLPG